MKIQAHKEGGEQRRLLRSRHFPDLSPHPVHSLWKATLARRCGNHRIGRAGQNRHGTMGSQLEGSVTTNLPDPIKASLGRNASPVSTKHRFYVAQNVWNPKGMKNRARVVSKAWKSTTPHGLTGVTEASRSLFHRAKFSFKQVEDCHRIPQPRNSPSTSISGPQKGKNFPKAPPM